MKLIKAYNQYLLNILPIINYSIYKNELSINIPFNKMIPIFFFLKKCERRASCRLAVQP